MAYEFITVGHDGPITMVTINRPSVMNAIHPPASLELGAAFDDFSADPDQWVAIITGAGERAFSAGNDLKYQAAGGKILDLPRGFGGLASRFDLNKPIIAAVNGVAMGGGFEMALACDIIVASENATFALPEPKVGLAAMAGGLQRLPRAIGLNRAMAMILTARTMTAAEAKDCGLICELVPQGEALAAARRMAEALCELSPLAVRASKRLALNSLSQSIETALATQWHDPAVTALLESADLLEGPRAFAEKRKPNWQGS